MDKTNMFNDEELENVVGGIISEDLKCEGVVVNKMPGGVFYVELDDGRIIEARLGPKDRVNDIRIIVGDKVLVELSPYEVDKGRITALSN